MATFLNTSPGKIEQTESGDYLFIYAGDQDTHDALPFGAVYIVVYSPNDHNDKWHAIQYEVTSSSSGETTILKVIEETHLEPNEITYFKRLIKEYQA